MKDSVGWGSTKHNFHRIRPDSIPRNRNVFVKKSMDWPEQKINASKIWLVLSRWRKHIKFSEPLSMPLWNKSISLDAESRVTSFNHLEWHILA